MNTYSWNDGTDYLAHHGIKGQKWGVRRFQYPDGTLTEAGKKRYDYLNNQVEKRYQRETKIASSKLEKNTLKPDNAKTRYSNAKANAELQYYDKLLSQRKKEIAEGLDYYERMMNSAAFSGSIIAGIPGSLVAQGLMYIDPYVRESSKSRANYMMEYKQQLNLAKDTYKKEKRMEKGGA